MDLKKFAKYGYFLLLLLAFVFAIVDAPSPSPAWMIWIVALLGIFVGVFGKGVEKATDIVILYLGISVTYTALMGLDFIGEYITRFLGNMLQYTGALVLTIVCYKFFKLFKE